MSDNCMKNAGKILSRRLHSETELRMKLRQKGFPENEISSAVAELKRLNFLDDAKFAESYFSELKGRGFGRLRILAKMRERGIPREIAEQVMREPGAAPAEDELDAARTLAKRKLLSLSRENDPRRKKEKFLRFIASRGFPQSTAYRLWDELKE